MFINIFDLIYLNIKVNNFISLFIFLMGGTTVGSCDKNFIIIIFYYILLFISIACFSKCKIFVGFLFRYYEMCITGGQYERKWKKTRKWKYHLRYPLIITFFFLMKHFWIFLENNFAYKISLCPFPVRVTIFVVTWVWKLCWDPQLTT